MVHTTSQFIVLYGTAVGMKVIHSRRIIHRDLKPDNVMLDDTFEPRIADFGFAMSVKSGQSGNQSFFGGTLHFMAPEIHEAGS
jgi:serine/threonine protein kinase